MPSPDLLLEVTPDEWRLLADDGAVAEIAGNVWPKKGESLAPAIDEISQAVREARSTSPVTVALDAALVFASHLELHSQREFRRPEALLYRLEETLPVAAEEMAAGFWKKGLRLFAVVAQRQRLEPLLAGLKEQGVRIGLVTPMVLLALADYLRGHRATADLETAAWRHRHGFDLVLLNNGHARDWVRVTDGEDADQELIDWELETSAELPALKFVGDEESGKSFEKMALATAHRIAGGQELPLAAVELAGQDATRSPLQHSWQAVGIAACLCLAVLTGVNLWRATEIRTAAGDVDDRQVEVFRDLYPTGRVPRGIAGRLRSELAKLEGVRGESATGENESPALELLSDLLAALPEEMRYRILECRIEDGRLYVSGEVRAHGDADRIAAALRSRGLEVKPPTTQRLPDQGVDFRLVAEVGSPAVAGGGS